MSGIASALEEFARLHRHELEIDEIFTLGVAAAIVSRPRVPAPSILDVIARASRTRRGDPLDRPCLFCEAPAGSACVTSGGNQAAVTHAIRADLHGDVVTILGRPCEICGAEPEQLCTDPKRGTRMGTFHSERRASQ